MLRIGITTCALAIGLATGCDTANGGSESPSGGAQTDFSREMFEANALRQQGKEDAAVDKYYSLCAQKHSPACQEIMSNAASDAALKQKMCFEAGYTPAC